MIFGSPLLRHGLKDMVKNFLSEKEVDAFVRWAFGEEYEDFTKLTQFAKAWHELHNDLYHIDYVNNIVEDLKEMAELWKKYGKK